VSLLLHEGAHVTRKGQLWRICLPDARARTKASEMLVDVVAIIAEVALEF